MLCGSKACKFLPVGSTSGFRMGSPPGPGIMYRPSRAAIKAPSSLSRTTSPKQICKYSNKGVRSSSLTSLKPASSRARFHGELAFIPSILPTKAPKLKVATFSTRPSLLVEAMTHALTASRHAIVISCKSCTSSNLPRSLMEYTSSMSRSIDSAMMRGRDLIPFSPSSGRSRPAMFTKVAIASCAVGGLPMVCRPHGRSRLSISMSFLYTKPTMLSRSSADKSLESQSGRGTSLSMLH
mmetsp:Transcript_3193/g.5539  ORF Transcript_3193/g.5539 Transcript_3193/m.5539 type:complete len:238 (+) Transcript_3193:1568-2281(+)